MSGLLSFNKNEKNNMKLTAIQLRRIIKEEVSKVLAESAGLSAAAVGIDLDSLNTKLDTEEQKEFLENLLAMNSDQLASQYSDISKEMNGRRSMVSPGTPDKEIIKMILDTAYPELDLYEDKVTLKEGHSRITQEELRAWKTGNLEFVSEVGSMSTGMRRKVEPDFHLSSIKTCSKFY